MANIYNDTQLIGQVIAGITNDITGSLFLTLLIIVTMFMLVMLLFRIPVEFQVIVIAPILFVLMAYYEEFIAFGGILLIFMGIIFARMLSK